MASDWNERGRQLRRRGKRKNETCNQTRCLRDSRLSKVAAERVSLVDLWNSRGRARRSIRWWSSGGALGVPASVILATVGGMIGNRVGIEKDKAAPSQ